MTLDLEQVDGYFESHLKRERWEAFTASERAAAVRMAELDVAAHLGTGRIDPTEIFQYCAVCEQALFLAVNPDVDDLRTAVVAESVEGVGSRRYAVSGGAPGRWSKRALAFLRRAGRPPRIGRG